MRMRKITAEDLHRKGVLGQPDTPGLDTNEMQRKVEEIARDVIIPALNENADIFDGFTEIAAEQAELDAHTNDIIKHIDDDERKAWNENIANFMSVRNNAVNIQNENGGFAAGHNARARGQNSIQLGGGENQTANTLQVYNFRLLNQNGNIPTERIPQIAEMSFEILMLTHRNRMILEALEDLFNQIGHISTELDAILGV